MPAWQSGGDIGVKMVSVFPDNAALNISTIHTNFVLLDGSTGAPKPSLDATEMTKRRTAAASALAARYLAQAQSSTLLMVDTGAMAPHLIRAHCATRPIKHVYFDLTRGRCDGRTSDDHITLFKSVGSSLEDLVAASVVYTQIGL